MTTKLYNGIYSLLSVYATAIITKYLVNTGLESFYEMINKPLITPPHHYFRYIWNTIYFLLFLGFYFALNAQTDKQNREDLNILFVLQLLLQILWSFNFFYLNMLCVSMITIILLDVTVIFLLQTLYYIHKGAFILTLPYFLWLMFATYLNAYIVYLN